MQQVTYVPPGAVYGDENNIVLGLSPPYILGSVRGISAADITFISSTSPGLDGTQVQGIRQESRLVTCIIHIKGDTRQDMYKKRFALIGSLTPREVPGVLYYENDFKRVRTAAYPQGSPDATDRIRNYNRAEIKFYCPLPYWEELTEKQGYMAFLDEGFSFPFSFNPVIKFAALANEATLINAGAQTPITITLKGPATAPRITNETTGEWIALTADRVLQEGETLIIVTKRGQKSVTILHEDGEKEDAFHYINPESVFFSLTSGENRLTYSSDNESENTQIFLTYREQHAGV